MRNLRSRAPGIALAAATAAALLLVAASPSVADTMEPTATVGDPVAYLIENQHAAGKVLEINNPGAQATGPDAAWIAAAAIFTIAEDAAINEQIVLAYPVLDAVNTYVLTNTAGDVLARRDNADEFYRYLEVRESTAEEAAVDPYAQWVAVDAGGGWVSLQNAQLDGNGRTAALDMYNWNTADGAEIQTYDTSSAAVQRWRMHPASGTVAEVALTTELGVTPTLPAAVAATYGWGRSFSVSPVAWEAPDPSVWQAPGAVRVPGTGVGLFGENLSIKATVSIPGDAVDATMTAYVGQSLKDLQMRAPRSVERTIGDSEITLTTPVTWDWSAVSDDATAQEGTFRVPATGSAFAATLVVTVTPASQVNLLREIGQHYSYTFKDGTNFALTDGVRNATGFADWRSGGASNRVNPNSVTFLFEQPHVVSGAAVYDIGGTQNVGGVTVQYRTLTSGWVDLPVEGLEWPYLNSDADLSLEVDSAAVSATGLRVVFTNKTGNTWMSLSEIEMFSPTAASER